MKKAIVFLMIMFCVFNLSAQKENNMWIFGYHFYPSFIPAMDFYNGVPFLTGSNTSLDFWGCDASICNSNGDLLFYTDGVTMMNYLHDTIAGSQSFNDDSALVLMYGYMPRLPSQSAFILPYPGNPNQYSIIHHSEHLWNNNQSLQPITLSMSIVDMSLNGGAGQMILKNQTIFNDTILFGTLQTVRHANGRDWWITTHQWKSNKFYLMLLTPAGISNVQLIQAGPVFKTGFNGNVQSLFSPDGNYFAIAQGDSAKVELFDFDRCTGTITFKEQIDLSSYSTTGATSGCSFSPNNKYLYVSDRYSLYQYDMNATNISNSKKLISNWDGTGSFYAYYFMMHQLGPDGKIYIAPPSSDILHVINNPNLADTACNFTQHSITLSSWHSGVLPVFPNFNLGPVLGSNCDSLNLTAIESMAISNTSKLFPNPNNGDFYFEYNLANNSGGKLEITDVTGRIIFECRLSKYTYLHHIILQSIKKGIYFLKFNSEEKTVMQKFLVIE